MTGANLAQTGAGFFVGPVRLDGAEIDLVAEIILGAPLSFFGIFGEFEQRGETRARLRGNETVERADLAGGDEFSDFGLFHFAAANDLVDHELAVLRLVAAEGFAERFAVGGRDDFGDAGDGVVLLEAFHSFDDTLRLLDDLLHELRAGEFIVLHLAELEFPFAGHGGLGEGVGFYGAEKLNQLLGFRGRDEFAQRAVDILLVDETVDRVGARGRSAETALLHGFGEFFIVDEFAGAFHRGEEGGLRIAWWRLGGFGVKNRVDRFRLGGGAVFGGESGECLRVR